MKVLWSRPPYTYLVCFHCWSQVSSLIFEKDPRKKLHFVFCLAAACQRARRSFRNVLAVHVFTWYGVVAWIRVQIVAQDAPKRLKITFWLCTCVGANLGALPASSLFLLMNLHLIGWWSDEQVCAVAMFALCWDMPSQRYYTAEAAGRRSGPPQRGQESGQDRNFYIQRWCTLEGSSLRKGVFWPSKV